ncbi:MAG: hypothetical protein VW270_25740 [Candidatus Poseidoniales archaeon]
MAEKTETVEEFLKRGGKIQVVNDGNSAFKMNETFNARAVKTRRPRSTKGKMR